MFFIVGPTAVGKSGIAVEVAMRCDAEIIGADAFQVYEGLDLLTAKPGADLRARVRHHLVGEIPLVENFDAGRYRELALERVREIEGRGKRALVVGGTGLYVRVLAQGLSELPGSNAELRKELNDMTLAQLQEKYAALDPVGMERIDRQNRRRLVRAIEVSVLANAPFSSLRADWGGAQTAAGSASGVVLECEREELYARIDDRVRRMFAEGVIEEVGAAGEAGGTACQAIGYQEIKTLLRGEINEKECMAAIQLRTRRYAKRQLTWLRRESMFKKINLTNKPQSEVAEVIARQILQERAESGPGGRGDEGQGAVDFLPKDV
jgi:tRNA dimethylallyltransferase